MTTTTPRRATNIRGYNKTVNKPPLTIPTISAAPNNADYTLLSPITISSSTQTRSLVSETPNCQDVALDATRCGLPTPPPSSAFNVPPPLSTVDSELHVARRRINSGMHWLVLIGCFGTCRNYMGLRTLASYSVSCFTCLRWKRTTSSLALPPTYMQLRLS
jgi:hypothetical protein